MVVNPFDEMYQSGRPAWDIGRAQPAFVELANAGMIEGDVLEPGCGTGENSLEMAERGHSVWGFDIAPRAIERARAKAADRGLADSVRFDVRDALHPGGFGKRFGTVIDCGLFHTFSDPARDCYERFLRRVLRPGGKLHVMVFSDLEDKRWGGPRRVSQAELMDTFGKGWVFEDIQPARFLTTPDRQIRGHAWLASLERLATPHAETPAVEEGPAAPTPAPAAEDRPRRRKSTQERHAGTGAGKS
jgi:SAM-dependent methyltransferase